MKPNAKFINTEKIEGYVYSTGKDFNQLGERVTGENSKNPGTKYIAGDLDIVVDETGTVNHVEAIRVGVDGEGVLVGAAQYVAAEGIFVVGKT